MVGKQTLGVGRVDYDCIKGIDHRSDAVALCVWEVMGSWVWDGWQSVCLGGTWKWKFIA